MKLSDAISIAIRTCIESTLEQCGGNVKAAAKVLGVHRSQIYKLANKHALTVRKPRSLVLVPELANWRRP